MAFGIGDDLSVKVSANTRDFEEGMENSRDELTQLSGTTQVATGAVQTLQSRVNELGDELGRTERKTSSLSRAFGTLSAASNTLSFSLLGISGAQLTGLIVGFGTLATTLAPLTASLLGVATAAGGVAAGFGAIIGTGIFAYGEQLASQNEERLQQIREEIKSLQELKEERAGLTKGQQARLETAQKTVRQIEDRKAAQRTLTKSQQEELEKLRKVRDEILKRIRSGENLTREEQKRLQQTRERIDELKTLRQETTALTEGEQARLESARETIDKLREKSKQERGLTETEKERLENLKETRDELKSQATITGALSEALSETKTQLRETALSLGQDFIPLIRDAINALPEFIERIENSVGNLQPFADALRDAGQVAFRVIPEMVEFFFDLGREALPVVRDLGRYLANNWRDILKTSVQVVRDLGDEFLNTTDAVIDFIPPMIDFGTTVLETVLPPLNNFLNTLGNLATQVENNARIVKGLLVGAFIAITGPLGLAISLLVRFKDTVVESLGELNSEVIQPFADGFNSAFENNIGEVLDETGETITLFIETVTELVGLGGDIEGVGESVGQAFNKIQDAIITVNDILQGETDPQFDKTSRKLDNFVDVGKDLDRVISELGNTFNSAGEVVQKATTGKWVSALKELEATTNEATDAMRLALVGEEGEGGLTSIFDDAFTNAQTWLQENGGEILRQGMTTAINSVADAATDLSDILVGPDGESGVMTDMVNQADRWFTNTMPELGGDMAQALGNGIRQGIIDLTNPLRGEDSEIWDMIADASTWLINNIPRMFRAVGEAVVNSIIEGTQGLFRGLVGTEDATFNETFNSVVGWFKQNSFELVGDIGGSIIDGIVSGIQDTANEIGDAILDPVENAIDTINDVIPGSINLPEISEGSIGSFTVGGGELLGRDIPSQTFDVPGRDIGGGNISIPGFPITGLQTGGFIKQGGLAMLHAGERVVPASQVSDRGEVTVNSGPQEVIVHVEGDTGVIRDVSTEVVEQRERRAKRQTGGNTKI
jgi:hypothetical protein